ncbi:OmpA family protein [Flavobacterium restrictum]|uniref:OmpA family protein n=1 Tax=Flavobacterium restrictum TaxID=2594428 RepID=UPI0037431302
MKIQTLIWSAFFSLITIQAYGQKSKIVGADKDYNNYAYIDAIRIYERIAEKGYKSDDLFQKLGNAYYFNAQLAKAEKWYTQLFAISNYQKPEYYYRYAQCLKSIGKYDKADEIMSEFNKKSGNDARAKNFNSNRNYLDLIKANSGRYTIEDAGINSKFSDYGSAFSNEKLIFASARDTGGVSKKVFKWTNQSFTNLYESVIDSTGKQSQPKKFQNGINSKFHEATPVFTRDGTTMYFTRNNYFNGKRGKDHNKVTLLKIYRATQKQGKWVDIVALPFNSDQYSTAHPALSPDEQTLYFASDMPGSLGQSDLFKVVINKDGSFGSPVNLGDAINTPGRETFPFIAATNELYYATDGKPGLGGLDVFVATIGTDGKISESQNVGEPVNSKTDDFAFLIETKTRTGFFTSNRDGGRGYDDIYKFRETRKLTCEQELSGVVTDIDTGDLQPNTQVVILDSKFIELQRVYSDEKANYKFKVVCGETYYVRATKPEYETSEQKISISKESGKTNLPIQLEKKIKPIKPGDDLAKVFGIKIIYFDLDKSYIREDAAYELEKILIVLEQNPTMRIDVRSHTDSRQTYKYNEALSSRRAKSTIAWLIKNGIDSSRLTGKGYGETQLVNNCTDGVSCSEEEHQSNRRSEFIIISM